MIWHSIATYLPLTEGWIHLQLVHQARHPQRVVTDRLDPEGARRFPFSPVTCLDDPPLDRIWRRLTHQDRFHRYHPLWQEQPAQLLHAHFGNQAYRMLPVAAHFQLPLVTTFYGYDCSRLLQHPGWRRRFQQLFDKGDVFLVEGPFMGKTLAEAGCPSEKIRLHHLGIPPRPFRERRPGKVPRVLMAASFREKKGLHVGLRALSLIGARLEVVVVGDGPLRQELQLIAEHGRLQVQWLGYLEPEQLIQEMLKADFFLQPSLTAADGDTEGGAPVTLLEAQATGLPVVATTHADIPEVTRPGESALLVPENDVHALAGAIEQLLAETWRWPQMGRAGQAHVTQEFQAATQGERLSLVYDGLIQNRGRLCYDASTHAHLQHPLPPGGNVSAGPPA